MNEPVADTNPVRVMIVEDHQSVTWGLERLVESAYPHMQVVGTATSSEEMLATAASLKPDLILLDLDLNGEISADALPELFSLIKTRVLILTGARDPLMLQAAILKGAHGVIGKEKSAEILLQAIERVSAGEVWIDRKMMGQLLENMLATAENSKKSDPEVARIACLTPREREIIRAIAINHGDKSLAIAGAMHISEHTLRNHLTVIYEKLGVRNRLDLYAYAIEHGLTKE